MAFPSPGTPVQTQFATSVTSMSVNMPATVDSGDRLIALVEVRNSGSWSTIPTGWTEKGSQTGGGGGVGELTIFEKFADGTEDGTTPTWIASTSTTAIWQVIRVTGAHASTSLELTTTSGDSSSANPPSLNPSGWDVEDTLWLAVAGHAAITTAAWSAGPSGYSGFQNDGASSGGSAVSIASAYLQNAAASEDPGTFTVSGSNRFWAAMTIAIRPAPSGIAFDAASNSGYQAASSSYSWSHTCTGSDRYLVVGVAMLSLAQTVSSITYNSVNLSLIGVRASISGAARVELWGLAAPATGSNTIAVTLTGSIASTAVATSLTGVHQTSPTEGFNSAQATNVGAADATVDVTTVADNDWTIDIVATDDMAITVGAGQTQRGNVTGAGGSGAMSTEGPKTPAGAVTMSWTDVGMLATWAIGSVAIRPIAAIDLSTTPLRAMMRIGT